MSKKEDTIVDAIHYLGDCIKTAANILAGEADRINMAGDKIAAAISRLTDATRNPLR